MNVTNASYLRALQEGRIIFLVDDVNVGMLNHFHKAAKEACAATKEADCKEVVISITSWGGSGQVCNALIGEIRALATAYDVAVVCNGNVSSAAVYIALALGKERCFAFPRTTFYAHRCSYSMSKDPGVTGTDEQEYRAREVLAVLERTKEEQGRWIAFLAEQAEMTPVEAQELHDNPRYIFAEDAVGLLIAGIVE